MRLNSDEIVTEFHRRFIATVPGTARVLEMFRSEWRDSASPPWHVLLGRYAHVLDEAYDLIPKPELVKFFRDLDLWLAADEPARQLILVGFVEALFNILAPDRTQWLLNHTGGIVTAYIRAYGDQE